MKLDPFYLIVESADWIARLVPLAEYRKITDEIVLRMPDNDEPRFTAFLEPSPVQMQR